MNRNASQWISIAQFLDKNPLNALGVQGGSAKPVLACDAPAKPEPELATPPSNTGVNESQPVARGFALFRAHVNEYFGEPGNCWMLGALTAVSVDTLIFQLILDAVVLKVGL